MKGLCNDLKRRLASGKISPPARFEPATPLSEVGSANWMLLMNFGVLSGADQTAQMRSSAFVVRIAQNRFSHGVAQII